MKALQLEPSGARYLAVGLGVGLVFLIVLHLVLSGDSPGVQGLAKFLLDIDPGQAFNWKSLQNIMWLAFSVGLADVVFRFKSVSDAEKQLQSRFLPEEDGVIVQQKDLAPIYQRVRDAAGQAYLPAVILQCILQFQSTKSVAQSNEVLTSQAGLLSNRLDLRYTLLRYLSWFIPTLGFIGTVYGIALALNAAGLADPEDPKLLAILTGKLSVAFYTTLLALLQSAVLVFLTQWAQKREEMTLNSSVQYCLTNLINRLYAPGV
jgi:biopolymer transport protein ExbB/TolQ